MILVIEIVLSVLIIASAISILVILFEVTKNVIRGLRDDDI